MNIPRPYVYSLIASFSFVAALAMVLALKACSYATKAMKETAITFKDAFSTTEKITQTFRSGLVTVIATHGNELGVGMSEGNEYFHSEHERRGWFGVYLGTTTAQINALCTFRYHLLLTDEWKLEVKDNTCVVHAPAFRETLPVAIHTDQMQRFGQNGWARFDKNDALDTLQAKMTKDLAIRAADAGHRQAVREQCRHAVREFVRTWLISEDQWKKELFTDVVVHFPDDPLPAHSPRFYDTRAKIRSE
jgi:hypothetical protein